MRFKISLFAASLAFLLSACATLPYPKIEGAMRQGQFHEAAEVVKGAEKEYGDKARLLYLMDRAMTLHLDGDYKASNLAIEEGSKLVDALYTTSVSSEVESLLVNDMSLPYRGDNYERVMLHVLGMLNYAALGSRDDAMVEAHQADEQLKAYAQEMGPDKVGYREDALARYLSAVLYEGGSRQELWDAYLDYKKADEAFDLYGKLYQTPKPMRLKTDLQRLAQGLGEQADLEAYRQRDSPLNFTPLSETRKDRAELVVLLYDGLAPAKQSEAMHLPIRLADGTEQYFSMALPKIVVDPTMAPQAVLQLSNGQSAPFELYQDVNAIAARDLQDKAAGLIVKATARALVKFQAARAVQKKAREAGGGAELLAFLGTNIYNLVSEQADIRSWRTLPGRILLARLAVNPGKQHPQISISSPAPSRLVDLGEVNLKPGQKLFLQRAIY